MASAVTRLVNKATVLFITAAVYFRIGENKLQFECFKTSAFSRSKIIFPKHTAYTISHLNIYCLRKGISEFDLTVSYKDNAGFLRTGTT
jgi:hypothetical protein